MIVADPKIDEKLPMRVIAYGDVFLYGGHYYHRIKPGIHLDNSIYWVVRLDDAQLTKFGGQELVLIDEGKYEPRVNR